MGQKHTKGEWEHEQGFEGCYESVVVRRTGIPNVTYYQTIAIIQEQNDTTKKEAEANARLIAASPKMLGQLIHTKTILAQLRPSDCLCDATMVHTCDRCMVDTELDSIEVLIAEAKK